MPFTCQHPLPTAPIMDITPLSIITRDGGLQRLDITATLARPTHATLTILDGDTQLLPPTPLTLNAGSSTATILLPPPPKTLRNLRWLLHDHDGNLLDETTQDWPAPRHTTFHIMISAHTDIGLHNSQYIQRYNASRFLDQAAELIRQTADRNPNDRYRFTCEGTWFWNNYADDRGPQAAQNLLDGPVANGDLGICCGIAGNVTQTFGLEELCRATTHRARLDRQLHGHAARTMSMIDNNGMSMTIIQPLADAGFQNVIFAPNQWNPLPSTIWKRNDDIPGAIWNPDAAGGGSRIDVRYDSALPMLFFWQPSHDSSRRLLVWAATQYASGAWRLGLSPNSKPSPQQLALMERRIAQFLPLFEQKYPYDLWLMPCYQDDQPPSLDLTNCIRDWNATYAWPQIRTLGNPDTPFDDIRNRFADHIPVLTGDITGGWYQLATAVADTLIPKYDADRSLPTAEKFAAVAALVAPDDYQYPTTDFQRAWDALLWNDEHSYGASGYQGQRVYETWMQHRDWIRLAAKTASDETSRAISAIVSHIPAQFNTLVAFNPTAQRRYELITVNDRYATIAELPPLGYRTLIQTDFLPCPTSVSTPTEPPTVQNDFYRLSFARDGSIASIVDRRLKRELLDTNAPFHANQCAYTQDNHASFHSWPDATFTVAISDIMTTVTAAFHDDTTGADFTQTVQLPAYERRIDITNTISHFRALVNASRYRRFAYYAFPFNVPNSPRRLVHLNGTVAEYAKSVTAHGTDTYMAAREWLCAENDDFGIALLTDDTQLFEFDHIHPDKTDAGNPGSGSAIYSYFANDWVQMHIPGGGQHLHFSLRYAIVSYEGNHRQAGIPQLAERFANPVFSTVIPKQQGSLPEDQCSFLNADGTRILTLKRADDGNGLVARLYSPDGSTPTSPNFSSDLLPTITATPCTPDERPADAAAANFATWRLNPTTIHLPERQPEPLAAPHGAPYSGLIANLCAASGEDPGHIYLLWGQVQNPTPDHYLVFRAESPDQLSDAQPIASVQPGPYRVVSFQDRGLREHHRYAYAIQPVYPSGQTGPRSNIASAHTRETL